MASQFIQWKICPEQIKIQQIEVAILTIPAERAQDVVKSFNGGWNQRDFELYISTVECTN